MYYEKKYISIVEQLISLMQRVVFLFLLFIFVKVIIFIDIYMLELIMNREKDKIYIELINLIYTDMYVYLFKQIKYIKQSFAF